MVRSILQNWQSLYSCPTDAERAIEPAIASLGVPYRFQHPIWVMGIFPDFALTRHKVIIEVDDKSHNQPAKKKADADKAARLAKLGWQVVRCTNEEAIANPVATVNRILEPLHLNLKAH